ncbi:hypothetical protein M3Y97_00627400 [Aphelenchoides bicaudatus]|nr:hypothetical protein M3Y97_00627400 [Aphelenchoides bicaudatus]
MDEDEILSIAKRVASLADGLHTIPNEKRVEIFIVSLEDNGLTESSLVPVFVSLILIFNPPPRSKNTKLIDYENLHPKPCTHPKNVDFVQLLKQLAEIFALSWAEINPDSGRVIVDYRKSVRFNHFLPAICFVQVGPLIRLVYYAARNFQNTLHTYSLFSFQNIQTDSKTFNLLIYQLIDIYNFFAEHPIFSAHHINADSNLWLNVGLHSILNRNCFHRHSCLNESGSRSEKKLNQTRLWELTESWRKRKISNFDYLMALNKFAGRISGDPHRNPILPWVVDFSSECDGFRDLSKTKYRLAKGDHQLTEAFKFQHPAHHIPELLTDICYMTYRARVETKETLCRYVRPQWTPEEYPNSVSRLYKWTPDECIPEFFEDPSIFTSIHTDLPDLQLPEWTKTPEAFIKWHREKLESEEVSANLHHWIDLIYGYKLTGDEAINALNVHLCFVRRAAEFQTTGTVQLFTQPHPNRQPMVQEQTPINNMFEKKFVPAYANDNSPLTNKKLQTIDSEEAFNLSELLERIYELHTEVEEYVEKSAMSIGVTIVEMSLPSYCRDLAANASFKDRLKRAQSLLLTELPKIPRHIRKALCLLLQIENDDNDGKRYRLSTSMLNFFSLPFPVVPAHNLLCLYHSSDHLLHGALINDDEQLARSYFLEKIDIVWNGTEFVDFNPIWRDLFIEMLQELRFAVLVCDRLFGRIMEYADGSEEDVVLKTAMIRLFEYNIPDLAVLFDRRFLLQLCIRFGSRIFFSSFLPHIVEALLSFSRVLHEVSKESVLWLTKRYGPIVTSTKITPCILRLNGSITLDIHVNGDDASAMVIDCLLEISFIYGPAFITLHYLPYCADLIDQSHKRLTPTLESAIISATELVHSSCNCLSDKQLMDNLQDLICDKILFPAVRLFCSTNVTFSNDKVRRLFACKVVKLIHLLGCRIGAENVQRNMSGVILRIFCTFNVLFDIDDNDQTSPVKLASNYPKQLASTFTPSLAKLLLHNFSSICSRQYILNALPNTNLIARLAATGSSSSPVPTHSKPLDIVKNKSTSDVLASVIGSNVEAILSSSPASASLDSRMHMNEGGNRLSSFQVGSETSSLASELIGTQEQLASGFDPTSNLTLNRKMTEESILHLADNWVDRFRATISATTDALSFDQIQLVTFNGHTAAIRRICALDNENSFITACQDKTVKLCF